MIESASSEPQALATSRMAAGRPRAGAYGACLIVAIASVALTGCIYRLPIRQGNYLDPAAVAQLKPGMTHSQVRYLLGTPMVPESFDNGRWDYDYYLNDHYHKPRRAHVTVYFVNDLVSRVQADVKSPPVTTTVTRRGVPVPNAF